MRICELAERAAVNIQTVRYYERRGLLPEPPRLPSGYREYDESGLARIRFVRRAQELGFTLGEVEDLLTLRQDDATSADDVKARALAKIADVDARIADLRRIRQALEHLAGQCGGGDGPVGECPLLDALGPMGG